MDALVRWSKNLSFTGSSDSGFSIPLGTDPSVGGDNDGFRPMELVLVALAGCTGMDVMSILKKKRQDITAFDVKVHADRVSEIPRAFSQITIEYIVTGRNVDRNAVERSVELSMTKYCPVHLMLEKAVPIETRITLLEAVE
jgi:putative redox protein